MLLARRVIHGEGWPDGDPAPLGLQSPEVGDCLAREGKVIYVDAEAVPQVQNERAEAWGMDRSRLFLMLPEERYGMIDFGEEAEQDRLVRVLPRHLADGALLP